MDNPVRAWSGYRGSTEDGRPLLGLEFDMYEQVRLGYRCGTCNEYFAGVALPRCDVCKTVTDPFRDFLETPRDWLPTIEEEE